MKRISLLLLLLIVGSVTAHAQQTQYISISGPLSVCVDGVTTYTYTAPYSSLTWSVTGGVFTSGFVNTGSVTVRWTSTSGSLSAFGYEEVQGDCYWDDANYPPVWVCEGNYTINYLTNAFNVSGATVGGGTTSGPSLVCSGSSATITLSGKTGSVSKWQKNSSGTWTDIASTATSITQTVSTTTQFRAVVTAGSCSQYSSVTTVAADPVSVGGSTVSTSAAYGTVSGTLGVSGNIGTVQRWEKYVAGSWVSTGITTSTFSYAGLKEPATYRAVVKSGLCSEAYAAAASIELRWLTYGGGGAVLVAPSGGSTWAWYKDGTAIYGATASSYTATDVGAYTVSVNGLVTGIFFVHPSLSNYTQSLNAVSTTRVLQAGVNTSTNLFALPPESLRQTIAYQDALGRTFQTVSVAASPDKKDLVAPAALGKQGLEEAAYLPFVAVTGDGRYRSNALRGAGGTYTTSEQYQFYQGTAKVATDAAPYAETLYRPSPDARPMRSGAVGQAWGVNAGHAVGDTVYYNNTTNLKLRIWKPDGTTTASYAANTAAVVHSMDENGHRVRTYTDARGRSVLKQVEAGFGIWLDTYSIYDDYGRLIYQLPPRALEVLGTGASLDAKSALVSELIYKYSYDSRGRLVSKKVPGAAEQYFVYDSYDRVVLTQDGNQRLAGKWMFVKYDTYGRAIISGRYTNAKTLAKVQAWVSKAYTAGSTAYPRANYAEARANNTHGYTNVSFPKDSAEYHTVSYFDDYDFDFNGTADYSYDAGHLAGSPASAVALPRGLSTGAKKVLLNSAGNPTSTWLISAVFYDVNDRPVQTLSNNHLYSTLADKTTILYDFSGKATKTKTTHSASASFSVSYVDRPVYDHAGRVLQLYRSLNGSPTEQLLVQYEYNALGQVVDKKLHSQGGGAFLQSLDYRYTIRGWLKSINNAPLSNDGVLNDDTNDAWGAELLYNTVDAGIGNTATYNGNLSAMKWKSAGETGTAGQRSYTYAYDFSDRLTGATFKAYGTSAWDKEVNTLDETLTYDKNGNIMTLTRKQNLRGLSGITVTSTAQNVDQLTYTYAAVSGGTQNTNRLDRVDDGAAVAGGFVNAVAQAGEYGYNSDGSLTKDMNKGIDSVHYTLQGKVRRVKFSNGDVINYTYDAAGAKLKMSVTKGGTTTTTDYVGGFEYTGGALSYFTSPEGRTVKNGNNYEYEYFITDHQGNTRAVVSSVTPAASVTKATFGGDPGDQSSAFANVNAAHVFSFPSANNTAGGSQVVRMNQTYASGPSKSLKVYPGDKVDAEVYTYYEANSGYGTGTPGVAAMVTAIAGGFGGVSGGGGESGSIYNGVNSAMLGFGLGGNVGDGAPAAFLNYILFDQQYKVLTAGWVRVPTSARFSKQKINLDQVNVKEAGFIFVYLSYENASNNYVYFDDFKVTHTKSNIVQSNEYYPFGQLTAGSWTRENAADNRYLANGGTELNRTSNLYDLEYRNYDPILGRLHQVDPMATKYASVTPYNYSFNNAVNLTDPSGADPENQSHGMWFGGGHYTYDDIVPNRYDNGIQNGRAGMMDGVDGWRGYNALLMNGGMGYGWAPGDNRLYWGNYESIYRDSKRLTTEEFANKYGTRYEYIKIGSVSTGDGVGSYTADKYEWVSVLNQNNGDGSSVLEAIQTGLDVVGVFDPFGVADGLNAAIYLAKGEYGYAAISAAAMIPIIGDVGKIGKYGAKAAKFTADQQALIKLAKEAKQKGGVTLDEAKILKDWAKEYNLPFRGPEIHPNRNFNIPHIHLGPVNKIPIKQPE